jgi:hypothetical protein
MKITPTPDGLLIESAHQVNGDGPHALRDADAVSFSDGVARVLLTVEEQYELRRVIGSGQLEIDNQTGKPVYWQVHALRNGVGPKFRIVLTSAPAPNARELGELEQRETFRRPAAAVPPAAPAPNAPRRGRPPKLVGSANADQPAKSSKGRGRARGKRGRPSKVSRSGAQPIEAGSDRGADA